MTDWSDEETDDPLYADRRNFYKVENWLRHIASDRAVENHTQLLIPLDLSSYPAILHHTAPYETDRSPCFPWCFQIQPVCAVLTRK
jgi:hypothetical protein